MRCLFISNCAPSLKPNQILTLCIKDYKNCSKYHFRKHSLHKIRCPFCGFVNEENEPLELLRFVICSGCGKLIKPVSTTQKC